MNEQLTQIYGCLHGMWQYRWTALLIAWVISLAGWLYVMSMPNQYSAWAVVHVDTTSVMKPLLKGLALETDTKDDLQVMSRVLLNRENLLTVVRETDMNLKVDTPEAREGLIRGLASTIMLRGGGRGKKRAPKSNIYEIYYHNKSPNLAYQVVSKLLNIMIEGTFSSSRMDTITAQKFLDTQIAEYERRLTQAEHELAEFKKENVGYMPDEKGGYYARLQRAQDALENTRSALRLAERRFAELSKQLKGEKPLLDESQLRQYQQQLGVLLNQFTEEHPDVQAIRSAIADMRANKGSANDSVFAGDDRLADYNPVYQVMKVDLSKAGVEIETLKAQLFEKKNRVKQLKGSIDVIPEVEARLSKLNRDYNVTSERYLNLVERREGVRLAQSAGQSTSDITFRIIEPPIVPLKPSGPKRLLLMTGVLMAAFGAGLGWSFINFLLQPTFISLQQVRLGTGLPLLGSVSMYMSPEHRKERRKQLASFLSATILLLCVYAGTVYNILL
jgi:polysaccharide chain length determinant protein (PEP-CTERM system associated)